MVTDLPLPPETPAPVLAAFEMARRHGLDRVAAISQFESYGNENWLLEGESGDRMVLRRYIHASPERVRFQLDIQRRLLTTRFPVARMLQTPSGEVMTLDRADVAWAAFDHVPGREYDFSLEDAVQAAACLAEFHLILRDLTDAVPGLAHRPPLWDCWRDAEDDLAALRTMFAGVDVDGELDYLEDWWSFARDCLPVERLDALPTGLVHGDFHGRNTAYMNGTLAAIFDFDDVEPGPLVHDLAWSAYKFSRESRFSLTLRGEVLSAFIAAYESVRPLTPEERATLPVMLAASYPPNPRYYRYYRDRGSDLEKRLRREVGAMRALREQAARLFP